MKKIKNLYKFEAINEYSLRNLKNAQIFFNAPISFNDPFDCSMVESSFSYKDSDVVDLYNNFQANGLMGDRPQVKDYDEIPQEFVDQFKAGIVGSIPDIEKKHLRDVGCTCFSEKNDHILMWAHYANGHKGMCLEFDSTQDPFDRALPITYSDSFPQINPINILIKNEDDLLSKETLKPLLTKYDCWGYEAEWRLFHKEPRKLYGYPVGALKAVYFGAAVNFADLEIVCLILQGQSKAIKFYRARKSKDKYELEFESFTYTPHIKSNLTR